MQQLRLMGNFPFNKNKLPCLAYHCSQRQRGLHLWALPADLLQEMPSKHCLFSGAFPASHRGCQAGSCQKPVPAHLPTSLVRRSPCRPLEQDPLPSLSFPWNPGILSSKTTLKLGATCLALVARVEPWHSCSRA